MTLTRHKRHPVQPGVPNVWLYPPLFDPDFLHRVALRDTILSVAAGTPAEVRVLDVGCGWMPYRDAFDVREYRGVDLMPHGQTPIELIEEPDVIPRPDASADVIVCWQVLEHVRDLAAFHQELRRCLVPGGTLHLTTHGLFRTHADEDYWRWTERGLRHAFEDAGWTDIRVNPVDDAASAAASVLNAVWGIPLGRHQQGAGSGLSLRLHQAMSLCTNLAALVFRFLARPFSRGMPTADASTYLVSAKAPQTSSTNNVR